MTIEEFKTLFMEGIDCSQVVAGEFADKLGMEKAQMRKMSACFGGGMQCGETCGAVTGALIVLGRGMATGKMGIWSRSRGCLRKWRNLRKNLLGNIRLACAESCWGTTYRSLVRWRRYWKRVCFSIFAHGLMEDVK